MPKYFYICKICEGSSSFYHAMSEEKTDCPLCDKTGCLEKKPSSFFFKAEEKKDLKTGQLVKESIDEFKEELEYHKNELKEEYYESS